MPTGSTGCHSPADALLTAWPDWKKQAESPIFDYVAAAMARTAPATREHIPVAATTGAIDMKDFLGDRLTGLWDSIHHYRDTMGRSRNPEILNTVDSVVDSTDSRIRLVPGYQKKLHGVIHSSLEYADELVGRMPAAIDVSRRTFTTNPYVNAFFTNVSDLQSVFSHSSEIQDYMDEIHEDDSSCCALLCMHRTEKTVLGMELSDGILKKDVRQVAVSFSDHRVYSPAPSEAETRAGLKHCLFQGLVTNALGQIMQLKLASHRLQSRHRILHTRLRHLQQRAREIETGSGAATSLAEDIRETTLELKTVEQEMMNTPVLLTPQVLLEQVTGVFRRPDNFVKVSETPLRLNKMGIRISDDSPEPGNRLELTEVAIGNESPRVVTLARFPREELLPRKRMELPG